MKPKRCGFTLLEVLAVLAIVAILIGLGSKGYSIARRHAKESRALADLELLRTALDEYRVEYGRYPLSGSIADISALPALGNLTNKVDKTIRLVDPWGNGYRYICEEPFLYNLWSEGQDSSTEADNIHPARSGDQV
jgi:general secretion pathway protein G